MLSAVILALYSSPTPDIQQDIEKDFSEAPAKLQVLVQNTKTTTFKGHVDPSSRGWKLSDDSYINIKRTMPASLAGSVLAACLAPLGGARLSRCNKAQMDGMFTQWGRNRRKEMTGMAAWCFGITIEPPLMLQIALLLSCRWLLKHRWDVGQTVAVVSLDSLCLYRFYCHGIIRASVPNPCFSHLSPPTHPYRVRKTKWHQRRPHPLEPAWSLLRDQFVPNGIPAGSRVESYSLYDIRTLGSSSAGGDQRTDPGALTAPDPLTT